jgi:hypothetical protein
MQQKKSRPGPWFSYEKGIDAGPDSIEKAIEQPWLPHCARVWYRTFSLSTHPHGPPCLALAACQMSVVFPQRLERNPTLNQSSSVRVSQSSGANCGHLSRSPAITCLLIRCNRLSTCLKRKYDMMAKEIDCNVDSPATKSVARPRMVAPPSSFRPARLCRHPAVRRSPSTTVVVGFVADR